MKNVLLLSVISLSTSLSGVAQSTSEFKSQLQKVHQSFFDGILAEDYKLVDQILSDDVTLGFPSGRFMPKGDYIDALKIGTLFYDSCSHVSSQIRIFGITGVINGQSNLVFRYQDKGEWFKMREHLSYTAVYVMDKNAIRMVSWHSNRLKTDVSIKVLK